MFSKLERSIREVHDLFIELGALVTQQGELINNIAYNVDQATDKVEKGRKQLSDAERHQRSARRKKVICATILFIVIVIILLVILGELGVFTSSPTSPQPTNQHHEPHQRHEDSSTTTSKNVLDYDTEPPVKPPPD